MNESNNPYAPPVAAVEDAFDAGSDGTLVPGGKSLTAGKGASWLSAGWQVVKQQPGTWIGMALIFLVIYIVVSVIPLLNVFNVVLVPLFTGGIMIACENQRTTGEVKISDLFAGFSQKLGPLALLGVMTFALSLVAVLGIMLVAGLGVIGAVFAGQSVAAAMAGIGAGAIALAVVAAFVVFFLIYAAIWYAPALIVLHDMPVFEAMKTSFTGGLRNILPGLVYGLVFTLLAIVASLPIFLGWLVLTPVMWVSIYAAYRDIYIQD